MKKFFNFLWIALLFFATEKLIRTQTDGFRIGKIKADFDPRPEWEVSSELPYDLLKQPYYFLGSGVQCYAFLSADGKTVLKVFKHYHLPPSSTLLRQLSLPKFLANWQKELLNKREKRIQNIFSSAKIAYQDLKEQTGVFFLNLTPPKESYPTISLYDKIGIHYPLDLNTTPFLLQKKAEPLLPYLKSYKEEAKNIIDSLFRCIYKRAQMGISNTDPNFRRNFGVLGGEVVEMDIGSFVSTPYDGEKSLFSKRELTFQAAGLKDWIVKNTPELSDYFEQKLLQMIRE